MGCGDGEGPRGKGKHEEETTLLVLLGMLQGWRVRGQGCRQPPRLRHDPIQAAAALDKHPWSNESSMMTKEAGPIQPKLGSMGCTAQFCLETYISQRRRAWPACRDTILLLPLELVAY